MTEQTSRLVIEISSEQAKKNAEELSKELVKIFTGGEKASDSTSKLGKTIQVTSNITQNFNTTVNNTTKAVEKQTQELAKQEKQVDKTGVAIKTLAGHLAAFITINSTIDKMDSYTGLQNRLKLVTNSQTELNRAMNDTFAIAQNTRQSWESAAQVYQGFANNAKALGLSMSDTARLTETVSKAVAISGSSAQASEAALIQFNQALSSGTLRGEELNSVMEQTPGLAKAIAEGMGITVGQLRSVAAQGKITSEELVKALTKSKASVDNLFSKTDITIGQSITLLNNELGKFIGEAGQSSGAAKTLADAIQLLSQNLGPLADGAMVVGIGYLTKSFLDKAVATRTAIAASVQHQTSMLAEQAATVELTGVEALRARQNVVLAAQEVRSAELALVNAKSKDAQALATQRLAAAEVAHNVALKESTIATAQYTLAQDALNKSKALGSKLLTAIGGPIGALTLAAMGLAAGYTYLQKRTEDANKKLAEQTEVANKTKEELLALQGVQKNGAKSDLEDAFKGQNKELKELNSLFNAHVIDLQNAYKGNVEIVEISNKVRQGVLSQEDAIKALNKLDFISPEQLKQLQKDNDLYREKLPVVQKVQEALKVFGIDAELAGNKASNSAKGFNDITKEAILTSDKVKNLSAEIQKFISSSLTSSMQNEERLKLYNQGLSKESADIILKAREAAGILGTNKQLPLGTLALLGRELLTTTEIKKVEEERSKSEKDRTKELEKQLKTQQRLIGISGNSGIGTGAHLDVRYGGSRDGQKVSPEHIARLQAGGKSLSSYRVSSDYGQRKAPTAGASSFHKGIDFAMPVGTPITTKVAVKDVKTAYDSKGGGYYSTVTFEDGVVLKLLHQSPSMQSKVKGGASTGTYGSYLAQDKAEAKTEKEIETLKANYYSLGEKDEADHIKRVKDLRKNGLHSLIADENTRFEKTKQLRQFEFTMEVDGWRWVGEEKIKNDAYVKKLRVEASTDFNKKEKAEAIKSFEEQRDFELTAYRRLQQDRLNEFKASLEQQTGELQRVYYEVMAQNTMSQQQLAMWQFQNQYGSAVGGAHDSYQNSVKDINKKDDKDQYLIDAETRNVMLIAAQKNLEAQLLLIKMKGVEDERVLRQQQYASNLSVYGSMFGQMAELVKGYTSESSNAYIALVSVQKAANLTSAIMNGYAAISAAWASAPFPYNIPNVTLATAETGVLQAAIQAVTPAFATGGLFTGNGHVRGAGTETSDSINAKLSDNEFVTRAWAVNKIGVSNLNYMNRTGELPFQREYEALKSQFTMPSATEAPKRFAEGGIVGVYNPDFERKQFEAIRNNAQNFNKPLSNPSQVNVNPQIVILDERKAVSEYLSSREGEQIILKTLKRNGYAGKR
ncbi:tape measure protein [Acinetobacter bereziniae]|uniref:tape measure protein n=1 Tax=Acinetobacter bereziniae TaxID=106648 RepID=UPI003570CE2D